MGGTHASHPLNGCLTYHHPHKTQPSRSAQRLSSITSVSLTFIHPPEKEVVRTTSQTHYCLPSCPSARIDSFRQFFVFSSSPSATICHGLLRLWLPLRRRIPTPTRRAFQSVLLVISISLIRIMALRWYQSILSNLHDANGHI